MHVYTVHKVCWLENKINVRHITGGGHEELVQLFRRPIILLARHVRLVID